MKNISRFLRFLHGFVGVGAIFGGLMAILNPEGPGGMATTALDNSPFTNFLIPGIILFGLIGVGNVLWAILFRMTTKYQGYISSVLYSALVIWIIVQCIMLRAVVILHIIYLIIGFVGLFFSIILGYAKRLYPTEMVHIMVRKVTKKDHGLLHRIGAIEHRIYNTYEIKR